MRRLVLTLFPALLAAGPAFAHLDPGAHGSFAAGLSHPVLGADHILAMVAVGLWAASLGGRAFAALPVGFVGAMTLGFLVSLGGLALPMVEPMILVSVLVLGCWSPQRLGCRCPRQLRSRRHLVFSTATPMVPRSAVRRRIAILPALSPQRRRFMRLGPPRAGRWAGSAARWWRAGPESLSRWVGLPWSWRG